VTRSQRKRVKKKKRLQRRRSKATKLQKPKNQKSRKKKRTRMRRKRAMKVSYFREAQYALLAVMWLTIRTVATTLIRLQMSLLIKRVPLSVISLECTNTDITMHTEKVYPAAQLRIP
jgi:hypothetical protein